MMKSLVSILWVMENHCFEQMAKTYYICKETAGSEWILEGETQELRFKSMGPWPKSSVMLALLTAV